MSITKPRKLRAFISVTDKTGLHHWKLFTHAGHEIVSTGGTAKELAKLGIPSTPVEEVTGFPEILDGRVKSMHPLITGAMLGDTSNPKHVEQMKEHGIEPFDVVVVNLYDFKGKPGIENIDVGGPTALRSAAKNGGCVTVVMDPTDYETVINYFLLIGKVPRSIRDILAVRVFEATAAYDAAIAAWMKDRIHNGENLFVHESLSH